MRVHRHFQAKVYYEGSSLFLCTLGIRGKNEILNPLDRRELGN